jgi:hypothetical protein
MVSLLDLAPSTRTVRVGGEFEENGADVSVFGVSAKGIASLLSQFPQLQDLFKGGELKFDAASIATVAPDAIAAIIAAGCDSPGDPAAVAVAERMPVGDQMKILAAVIELTMPDGIGPFMEALDATIARLDFGNRGKAPASK